MTGPDPAGAPVAQLSASDAALASRYWHDPIFHARVTVYRRRRELKRVTPEVLARVAALPEWTYLP